MHELTPTTSASSSSESINPSPTKRIHHNNRHTQSPQINNSLTTDSCSQSPSSFENLAPMKTLQPTSSYLHTMNVYHHQQHATAFHPHYSGLNF